MVPGGAILTFSYDAIGNLTAFTDVGGTVNYSYNAVNLLSSLTDPSGAKTTYGYDNNNRRTGVTYPNGVTMTLTYDSAGHETGITAKNGSTTLAGYTYTYGTTDLRQNMTDQVTGLVSAYHYGTMNRLTEGSSQTSDFKYSYDKAGNRTSQTINGTSTTFSYNAKDQAISMAGVSMTYTGTDQAERVQAGGTTYVNAPFGVSSQIDSSGTTYFTRESNGTLTSERTPSGTYY